MRGANINAAATGLMQGIQYMDERNRRLKQDERQSRRDALDEQQEARRAEVDGLTLQKTKMEMADYEADKPLREGERAQKLKTMEQDQKQTALMDRLAEVMARDDMTGSLDGRIGMLNELGSDFGTQVKGGTRDPKTGKLVLTFTTADGKEQVGEYNSIDDLDDDILMLSDKTYRAKALQDRQSTKAESAKEERKHKRKLEEIKVKGGFNLDIARLNNTSREAIADAKLLLAQANGKGTVVSEADKRVQTLKMVDIFKMDNTFNYKPDENGNPNFTTPYTPEEKYRNAYRLLYGDEVAPTPAPAAAAGVTPPAAAARPAPSPSGSRPVPVIDLEKFKVQ